MAEEVQKLGSVRLQRSLDSEAGVRDRPYFHVRQAPAEQLLLANVEHGLDVKAICARHWKDCCDCLELTHRTDTGGGEERHQLDRFRESPERNILRAATDGDSAYAAAAVQRQKAIRGAQC